MNRRPAPHGFAKPLLILGVVILILVVLVASGALKLKLKVTRIPSPASESSGSSLPTAPSPTSVPQTKTFTNSQYGFSVEYPADWILKESVAPNTPVGFLSRREDENDKFSENTLVTVVDLSSQPAATTAAVADSCINNPKHDSTISSFTILERSTTTLADTPAEHITYTAGYQGLTNKGDVYITIKNQRAMVVNFTSETSAYGKYLPGANTIFSSFKFN